MARTLEEIRLSLCNRFIENPTIQASYGLTPGNSFDQEFSKVSLEAIIFFTVAFGIFVLEGIFDELKEWVENRAKQLKGGSLLWYANKAKEYQHGDSLVETDEGYSYPTINEANQIIKFSAAIEVGNTIIVKVAKLVSEEITPLDAGELVAFEAYMNKIRYAGNNIQCASREADLAIIQYHVYIDGLVLAADGSLLSNPAIFPVEDAINEYIGGLKFNGIFATTELTDAIQKATGVINPVYDAIQVKFGANPYTSFSDYYTPNAGYMKIDPVNPLSATINYIIQ